MRFAILWMSMALLCAPAVAWADGPALYGQYCASCHGDDASGDTPVGKAMKVPNLATQARSVDTVVEAVRGNGKHASVSGKVDDDTLRAIGEHMASLPGAS